MRAIRVTVLSALLVATLMVSVAWGQTGTIEQITIYGTFRMTQEAAKHALGIEVGDPYDPSVLRNRFRAMWELGLFEDLTFEVDDGPGGGKFLVVTIQERAVLTSVTYQDNKILNRTQIEDRFREKEVDLGVGRPLDLRAVADAEVTIRDYLGEKGFLDAYVDHDIQRVTDTTRAVHFSIRPGGKTRVKSISFTGNEVFSSRKLKAQLELTEARKWYWPWTQKNLYHPLKWDQDSSNIRNLYQNAGYLDIEMRPPILEFVEKDDKKKKKKGADGEDPPAAETVDVPAVEPVPDLDPTALEGLTPKEIEKEIQRQRKLQERAQKKADKAQQKAQPKTKKWVHMTVPISEGQQYTAGEVTIEGNEVFSDAELRGFIPLRTGGVLRQGLLDGGTDAISRRYEDRGHLYASVVRQIQRHDDEPVADILVTVDEDEPYFVETIEFIGNSSTQDRVLRRELLVNEGSLFNRTRLDISRTKISQLGYVEVPEDPIVEPIEGENRVRVRMPILEKGRNEIQVGGGYSGFDGAFFTGVYSTRNFLGRGQTLSLSVQVGGRSNRYSISFQEPWFLNKPYTVGASIFLRDVDYGGSFKSTSKGGGLILAKRLGNFTNLRLAYQYENVESTSVLRDPITGEILSGTATASNTISSITPIFTWNLVNNPYRPTGGQMISLSLQIAGGPLAGDTSFLKPIVQYTRYQRAWGKFRLAFHGEIGKVQTWAEGTVNNTATINGVPRFQRFWLGGETAGPRVFETRTITPLRYVEVNANGTLGKVLGDPRYFPVEDFASSGGTAALVEVGGDRFYMWQSELVFPINEQAEIAGFIDIGDALFEDTPWGFDNARVSAGLELRLHLPVFPVPLRLIYGWPIRKLLSDRTSSFTFAIGQSF